MQVNEVEIYSSQGKVGCLDSAKVVVDGQEFLFRFIGGKLELVAEPEHVVQARKHHAKAIAFNRLVTCQKRVRK
ncbi:MAG: hypothetical protein A3D65_01885 [Candidatus Lloydbacteria bacterium RIFCSPHIGHO2_02_FULL_50_13]|uniref:Uncharacterized protein n=1 Tax=Candidatus Lloydbacteria bacterium RIFCSPHIGHO2_02_FULL_50_13 TaxID=1798661 RepID=A0A1G2D2Z6_9BACT|nr:MAG: hypothetical protein A3D65_01885 [Candidatus Lloydbacteria bacterium RIFCSPHIGHO2_02_FULL_50_13]